MKTKPKTEKNPKMVSLAKDFAVLAKKHSLIDPRLILSDNTQLIAIGTGDVLFVRQPEVWTEVKS